MIPEYLRHRKIRVKNLNHNDKKVMDAKPIFIIRVSERSTSEIQRSQEMISRYLYDYHVVVLPKKGITEPEFECYNTIDTNDIKFEELKEMVSKYLEEEYENTKRI